MKKYIAAAAVAVMVFAFAAFAASLNVDGGVLQAGADHDLTCTEETVEVLSYRIEGSGTALVGSGGVRLGGLDDCAANLPEGEELDVFIYAFTEGQENPIARSIDNRIDGNFEGDLIANWGSFGQGPIVDAENIDAIQVVLESAR